MQHFQETDSVCTLVRRNALVLCAILLVLLTSLPQKVHGKPADSKLDAIHAPIALMAGRGEPGLKDGPFHSALFSSPRGIAYTPTGNQLYVSDRYNYAIRRIRLNHFNDVDTIIESSQPRLAKDRREAIEPGAIAFVPPQTIVVFDYGLTRLVFFDVDAPSARTYVSLPSPVVNMVAIPDRNGVLYTLENSPKVFRTTIERKQVEEIPLKTVPPIAANLLYWHGSKLLIGSMTSQSIYTATYIEDTLKLKSETLQIPPDTKSIFASKSGIFAVTSEETAPVVRIDPDGKFDNISIIEPSLSDGYPAIAAQRFALDDDQIPAAITDPSDPNRVAISFPKSNKIVEFNDSKWYEATARSLANQKTQLYNFSYGETKPNGVTRILTVGDPRLKAIGTIKPNQPLTGTRFDLLPTILNLELNERAALTGMEKRYEVLNLVSNSYDNILAWAPVVAPKVALKYDVDHVIFFIVGSHSLSPFFLYPTNIDGELEYDPDNENETFSEAHLKDRSLLVLLRLLRQEGLLTINSGKLDWADFGKIVSGSEIRSQIKRLLLLSLKKWIKDTTTLLARTPSFTFVYVPSGSQNCCTADAELWGELAQQMNAHYVDLSPEITTLYDSYFPIHTDERFPLFTLTGHRLIAELLANRLSLSQL
jgi:hypothetical protein